ncbi:hypothetical protein DEU56DRAFT_754399 [Suillus clintonianus]|uniref:uncharacterized protein n=1 Tax=Suillus clintonianus TaxID=1904413 RepID=UPI001B87D9C0|nr:uncharacterized protein DEU56DRAFT_754399 [Suillus clintonianus]KAG2144355.1 hypothetical protein DEU56DRAFT_754399 [Suillus clintonianus]
MDPSTGAFQSCASDECCLPLTIAPLRDASAISSGHASVTDDHNTPLPNLEHPTLNPNNCIIIIQNNCIAEGGTINIFSSRCNGSTTTEPTPLQPPSARQAEPAKHGQESIVLSGNTFGECCNVPKIRRGANHTHLSLVPVRHIEIASQIIVMNGYSPKGTCVLVYEDTGERDTCERASDKSSQRPAGAGVRCGGWMGKEIDACQAKEVESGIPNLKTEPLG